MKYLKYSWCVLVLLSLFSCLKPKNDLAGLRTDKGGIVVSIAEAQYVNTDAQTTALGWSLFTNFNFAARPNEAVKFFTLHISQPRETKLSGPLSVQVTASPVSGYTAVPAGAITIPANITVPESSEPSFDFPVLFTVNKSLLDPTEHYAVKFTITGVSQGVFSELDKTADIIINNESPLSGVLFNTSNYAGRYRWTSTVEDPAGQYGVTNNTKPVVLEENAAGVLEIFDYYAWAGTAAPANTSRYIWANNLKTGVNTAIFRPEYHLESDGKIMVIINASDVAANSTSTSAQILGPSAVSNIALDAASPSQFNYVANHQRNMAIIYSFDLTTTINGASVTRKVKVTESFTYDKIQAFY